MNATTRDVLLTILIVVLYAALQVEIGDGHMLAQVVLAAVAIALVFRRAIIDLWKEWSR